MFLKKVQKTGLNCVVNVNLSPLHKQHFFQFIRKNKLNEQSIKSYILKKYLIPFII